MTTALASLLLAATAAAPPVARPSPAVAASPSLRPKLVLALTIDQFRYDYLTRFRSEYTAGLRRLLDRGAVFTRARHQHLLRGRAARLGRALRRRAQGRRLPGTDLEGRPPREGSGTGLLRRGLRKPLRQRPARGAGRAGGGGGAAGAARRDRSARAELLLQRRRRPRERARLPRGPRHLGAHGPGPGATLLLPGCADRHAQRAGRADRRPRGGPAARDGRDAPDAGRTPGAGRRARRGPGGSRPALRGGPVDREHVRPFPLPRPQARG